MAPKRMKYAAEFKRKAVEYALETNNSNAARKFGVNEKLIRDWKKNIDIIREMSSKKCANRGAKCYWPEMEKNFFDWVNEQRANGYIVTRMQIRIKAIRAARELKINNFKGTVSWCARFMTRNKLVLRQKTKVSQKLPQHYEEKVTSFHRFIIRQREKMAFTLAQIGHMDETPVWFDMPHARTVSNVGEKTVLVKTTGHEKSRFTVLLACMADGTKLKPMVIFKRKTMPKIVFPKGVIVHCHTKGWMDENVIKIWIEKVWARREGGLFRKPGFLVWDSFSAHLVDRVKTSLKRDHNTTTAVIPGGLTSIVQLLDVCLNKPFKDRLHEKWCQWMMDGEKTYTKGGNIRAASLEEVCRWVIESWEAIGNDMKRSFKKCGISNALDGTRLCIR